MLQRLATLGLVSILSLLVFGPGAAALDDGDGDGIRDDLDNCLAIPNPTQLDTDADGFGNACDADYDNDGIVRRADKLALTRALGTTDANLDLTGDGRVGLADLTVAESRLGLPPGPSAFDPDGDGFALRDNCLAIPNPTQLDTDADGFGNACDADYDNDGVVRLADTLALTRALGTADANLDLTGDGRVGLADLSVAESRVGLPPGPSAFDPDGDGFALRDNCLAIPNPTQLDTDADGFGNACDADYDNDGVVRLADKFALTRALGTADANLDLTGDGRVGLADLGVAESRLGLPPGPSALDPDGDGLSFGDNCPDVPNPSQEDRDGDGLGDACDPYAAAQECLGSQWQPPALPVVTATCDRDGVPACSSEDLSLALLECSRLGGCVLQLLARTYSDVAINLHDGSGSPQPPHGCQPEMSHCLTARFPNGLVIQGHGPRSVLQSRIFSGGQRPYPVLRLYRRPDIHLRMRNLTLDGVKERQQGLTVPYAAWHHSGFETSNYFASLPRNASGCIHNVTVRNFMSKGLDFGDVENWVFEYNTVSHIGCHDTLTPCPGLVDTVAVLPSTDGYRVPGSGIGPGSGSADLIYRGNVLSRITKYSLHFKGSSDGFYLIDGGVMVGNHIVDSGSRGIFVAGLKNGWIVNNRIEQGNQVQADGGFHASDLSAISLAGGVESSVFADNEIRDNAGPALEYKAVGDHVVFMRTRISGDCGKRNPSTCNSPRAPVQPGQCFDRAEISIDASAGSLRFEDTSIANSLCKFVLWTQPGVETVDIDLVGGTLRSGPFASVDDGFADYGAIKVGGLGVLTLDGGVVLRNQGHPEVDGVVATHGESTVVVRDARVEGFAEAYKADDYRGGGTFVFCDRDPTHPLCR